MDLRGSLLIAVPALYEPNFYRTTVLVCDHDDEGSLGLVLNRPTEAPVAEYLPGWDEYLADPPVVFVGGPVSPETAVGLARLHDPEPFEGWTPIAGSLGLLDLSLAVDAVPAHIATLRVFSGYAGWGPGQLDAELDEDGWFVVSAADEDPFRPDAADLWRGALRRQSTRLRLYADFPPHPSYN